MKELLKQYEPLLAAIVELFHPFVEIAVHDVVKGKIAALYHTISNRKVGDPSPLKELQVATEDFPDRFSPYYRQNYDGSPLKCTSISLRDKKGKVIGLICINIDAKCFQENYKLLATFLNTKQESENPIELFGGDSAERIDSLILKYVEEKGWAMHRLSRNQKKEIVQYLFGCGAFHYKNAVATIAQKLHLSRATVYNHIKQ